MVARAAEGQGSALFTDVTGLPQWGPRNPRLTGAARSPSFTSLEHIPIPMLGISSSRCQSKGFPYFPTILWCWVLVLKRRCP
eukprot:9122699-Pyramimonas_sp.AAC.1